MRRQRAVTVRLRPRRRHRDGCRCGLHSHELVQHVLGARKQGSPANFEGGGAAALRFIDGRPALGQGCGPHKQKMPLARCSAHCGGCRQGSAPPAKQASAAGRASSAGTALSSRLTCPCPRPRPAPAPAGRLRTRADVTGAAAGQHRADSSRSVQAAAAHISAAGLCSDVKTGPGEPHTSN